MIDKITCWIRGVTQSTENRSTALFLGVVAGLLFLGSRMTGKTPPLIDEANYYLSVVDILSPQVDYGKMTSVLPGYAWTVAFFARILNIENGQGLRGISAGLSFLTVVAFWVLARKTDKSEAVSKSLQLFFLPILFPFFFLLYSDAYSLFWIFIMLLAVFYRRFWAAATAGMLSVFVRQSNILWVVFALLLGHWSHETSGFVCDRVKDILRRNALFFLLIAVFGIFFIWNNGPAWGDQTRHPVSLNLNNVTFCLFLFFPIFLPLNLANFPKMVAFLKAKPWGIAFALGIYFVAYMLFFKITHPFNRPDFYYLFLRNKALAFMTSNPWVQGAAFLPVAYSFVSLCVTPLHRKSYYLIYPASLIFLAVHPLIEQRYYLIPYALFLAMKKESSVSVVRGSIGYSAAWGLFFYSGIIKGYFFL